MNAKKTTSLIIFISFTAIAVAFAYALCGIEAELWLRLAIGGGALLLAALLALIGNNHSLASVAAVIFTALASGVLLSALFSELGKPEIWLSVLICAIFSAAFFIYCLLANLEFLKERCTLFTALWCILAAAGALVYALLSFTSAGWLTVALLAPFIMFLFGLIADAANICDHIRNNSLIPAIALFSVVIVLLHIINPSGSLELPEISSDSDEPYGFTAE